MPKGYQVIASMGEDDLKNVQKKDTKDIDIIEVRLDLLSRNYIQKELKKKVRALGLPALFTYRRAEDSNIRSYVKLFPEDVESIIKDFNDGTNYLDIELNREDTLFTNYDKLNYKIVYSYHSFKKSINLREMQNYIQNSKPVRNKTRMFKFAITPEDIQETSEFLSDIRTLSKTNTMIGICMGEVGVLSRIFGDKYGSNYTYTSLGEPKAPGQISVETFKKLRPDLFDD